MTEQPGTEGTTGPPPIEPGPQPASPPAETPEAAPPAEAPPVGPPEEAPPATPSEAAPNYTPPADAAATPPGSSQYEPGRGAPLVPGPPSSVSGPIDANKVNTVFGIAGVLMIVAVLIVVIVVGLILISALRPR
jgi:hypothetical protein